ncbi:MAG: mannose-1-phosphate guanylyltransferase [Firmicutes bacterium]|nr:mannose-1-phosphate guanylyltransferase [Bacillota bacterium]MCL5040699.1 mannose-1-phosphate guanylyltransferase [Bacillota bacterium]
MFAVIMAGGRGERFWPWSRGNVPKQFLKLTGQESMLQETVRRVSALVEPSNIYVVTGEAFGNMVQEQLPGLPVENIVLEPVGRNTAPALGLVALLLEQKDPKQVMLAIPADHHIGDEDRFIATLSYAASLARQLGAVGTIGLEPTRPETGYGYIERGDRPLEAALDLEVAAAGVPGPDPVGAAPSAASTSFAAQLHIGPIPNPRDETTASVASARAAFATGVFSDRSGRGEDSPFVYPAAYPVLRFVEKPHLEQAREYLRAGRFYWNSGMFIWQVSTFLELTERFLPKLAGSLDRIRGALGTPLAERVIREEYPGLESISVDYGIMERAQEVFVVPASFGWDDVGSWTFLDRVLPKDRDGNAVRGCFVGVEARNLVVHTKDKLVAALGVEDLIIVEAEDSILICPKDRAQEVRKIVEKLRERKMEQYL